MAAPPPVIPMHSLVRLPPKAVVSFPTPVASNPVPLPTTISVSPVSVLPSTAASKTSPSCNSAQAALLLWEACPPSSVEASIVGSGISPEYAENVRGAFSVGFDSAMYDRMGRDVQRVSQYNKAIAKAVAGGKLVLDLGTGRDALLAQMCARAGAKHTTAVEVLPDVAAAARRMVCQAGLASLITVIEGHSGRVALPRVDIVVHEIVGGLAAEEGMAAAIRDLQQRPDVVNWRVPGWSLPRYVETRVAPLAARPGSQAWAKAAAMAAQLAGRGPHTLKVASVERMPAAPSPEDLLGSLQSMDHVNAEAPIVPVQEGELRWRFDRQAVLEGFACAPWLDLDGEHVIDAWIGGTSWRHKLVGLDIPVIVGPGDEVSLRFTAYVCRYPVQFRFVAILARR